MDNVTAVRISAWLIFFVVILLYFAPAVVGRKKSNFGAIFALNLLLGWTLVGWVIALVWALTTEAQPVQVVLQGVPFVQQASFCAACGKTSEQGAAFCTSCGHTLVPQRISATSIKAPPSAMN